MFSSRTRREVKVFKNERQTMEDIQKNQVGMALFLSAYMHQGDDLFSAESRGKQCAFMSLSAILTAENMPLALIDWSKTTFNNVLLQGDKMYLRALNNGLIVLEPSIEFLSVDNLPKVVGVSCCRNMFSYEIDLMSQTISSAQSNINNLPIVVESNIDLPIVVEPIEAQKKRDLPNVVEPIEAQNKSDLPIVAEPIEAQNNIVIDLPIVVEPIEAKTIDLPIVVEPIEAKTIDLPIVVERIDYIPLLLRLANDVDEIFMHIFTVINN